MDDQKGLAKLDEKAWYGRMLVENVLAVDVPMISAVNGPCNIHSEVPLLGDIVLASEDAYFQDLAHFPRGMVPGDGQHVIWPRLIGRNRARYLLLTGKKLARAGSARVGRDQRGAPQGTKLLDRAWELARELAKRPPLTLRYTRMLFTQDLKRAFLDELAHGLARETYAQRQFFPVGAGMAAARPARGTGTPWSPWYRRLGRDRRLDPVEELPPGVERVLERVAHARLGRGVGRVADDDVVAHLAVLARRPPRGCPRTPRPPRSSP